MSKNIPEGADCFIYLRVSSQRQFKEGFSLENQRRRCEDYANVKGMRIRDVFSDGGISGSNFNRKGFQEMKRCIRAGEYILIYSFTRLGRNQVEAMTVYNELCERGVKIISVTEEHVDNTTPMGKFMLNTLLNAAEYELNEIDSRSKSVLEAKALCGEMTGSIPFGYDVNVWEGRKYVYPIAFKQDGITYAITSRQQENKISLSQIGKELIRRGCYPSLGGNKWSPSTIDNMVEVQTKMRIKYGLMNISLNILNVYEKYRAPFIVPVETILNNINQDTGHLDYIKVFGYMYGTRVTRVPPPATMRDDIISDRLKLSSDDNVEALKILNDNLNINEEEETFDLSKQDPVKLNNFLLINSNHVSDWKELNKRAKLFFK